MQAGKLELYRPSSMQTGVRAKVGEVLRRQLTAEFAGSAFLAATVTGSGIRGAMEQTHLMTKAERMAIRGAARDLHERFRGIFGEETIEALLHSSYAELADTATVRNWLCLGAERFARQRLQALAHA